MLFYLCNLSILFFLLFLVQIYFCNFFSMGILLVACSLYFILKSPSYLVKFSVFMHFMSNVLHLFFFQMGLFWIRFVYRPIQKYTLGYFYSLPNVWGYRLPTPNMEIWKCIVFIFTPWQKTCFLFNYWKSQCDFLMLKNILVSIVLATISL